MKQLLLLSGVGDLDEASALHSSFSLDFRRFLLTHGSRSVEFSDFLDVEEDLGDCPGCAAAEGIDELRAHTWRHNFGPDFYRELDRALRLFRQEEREGICFHVGDEEEDPR